MFMHMKRENAPKIKRKGFYAQAGLFADIRDDNAKPLQDPKSMELTVLQSQLNYVDAHSRQDPKWQALQPQLVQKIAIAVVTSLPQLTVKQMQHAMFVKQMYHAGEIDYDTYVNKMFNLFPERMRTLPHALQHDMGLLDEDEVGQQTERAY